MIKLHSLFQNEHTLRQSKVRQGKARQSRYSGVSGSANARERLGVARVERNPLSKLHLD